MALAQSYEESDMWGKAGEDRYFPVQIDRTLESGVDYDMFIIWAANIRRTSHESLSLSM